MQLLGPPNFEEDEPDEDDFNIFNKLYYPNPDDVIKKYTDPERLKEVIIYLEEKVLENKCELAAIKSTLLDLKDYINRIDVRLKQVAPEEKPYMLENAPLNVVERSGWGALNMKDGLRVLKHPITKVNFTFSTNTESCDNPERCAKLMKKIQIRDMKRGLPDIAHNFLVAEDGNVYEGRGWHVAPAVADTTPSCESSTLDVAFAGNFLSDCYPLELFECAIDLVNSGIKKKFVSEDYKML